jgi:hypothetical protein
MRCSLYLRIAQAVEEHDNYFVQRRNAAGALGFSCLQKVIVAYRQLAYAVLTDYVDEYVRIEESTVIEFLRRFVMSLARNILGLQINMIQPDCFILLNDVDFLECLIVSIIYIGSRKIVQLHDKRYIVAMSKNQPLY